MFRAKPRKEEKKKIVTTDDNGESDGRRSNGIGSTRPDQVTRQEQIRV